MVKTRQEVKDMWWKVMAKILLAEHRERREKEKEVVASGWERASRSTSPTSRSFASSEETDSSLRPEDCFSTVNGGGSVHSEHEDNGEDAQQSVQATTSSDPSNPEFDQWYAEWFSQWVLESSRKLRSPESESRFSSYCFASSTAASVIGSDHDEEESNIRSRPATPTPLSSPTISARGRVRYRCPSLSGSNSSSSVSPTRRDSTSIPALSSPVYRSYSPCRGRSPSLCWKSRSSPSSHVFRRRPSPRNIDRSPLPPSSALSHAFPTCTSSSPSPSRPPSHSPSRLLSRSSSPTPSSNPTYYIKGRPTNAETEDYLSNAHLLRFPATVSARLMMTAETLGVDGEGKRKLVQELQRTPSASSSSATVLESGVRVDGRRRTSEEVKGFDWGFGMGRKDDEGGEEGFETQ
ncbi:hypothetical protein QBC32DRAFT_206186 [Pseudoneurospora amorphoporcata]|uniref:Uncharacterized protein n=1 Tax=Pseudoneurospora amorphoporcata TaxID=241081 RepID=A0AAN6P3W9_9PEZI|nr:hypothetical protein QBC32DRAFT_206186 [Pseudoneurospora amorphoporcata]